ncbi:uncharacterized protein Dana_GF18632 [Drosophila ananassae]|uniref:Uncharacterized protein n=1 Tax=Drosophila ananassae TaxID=7217 RepID=B3LWA9_DROAN|nr:uncharacterized protein LOC6501403 [Drosophila ananassae]EDV43742.1 uncharacterized protein Dana_GF18632 [Drosophila ananassae]
MDFDDDDEVITPHYARKFKVPSDPMLLAEYELFNPTSATLNLHSEHNREIFAEAFIEGDLDTLEHLCVKSLAKLGTRGLAPILLETPELMRVFYDSLDVELPLRECYVIDDQRFWRRVVLSKTLDKTLHLKRLNEFDWKSEGVSRKFVELLEDCPVNIEPETKLARLAGKVWEYVNSMHVRRLQALPDYKFNKFLDSEPDQDITSSSSDEETISSDEPDTDLGLDGEEGEEEDSVIKVQEIQFWRTSSIDDECSGRRAERRKRNAARQAARDLIAQKRQEHEGRKQKLFAAREALANPPPKPKKKKKKKTPPIQDVFNIPVEPEPEDDEDTKPDQRNKTLMLNRIKRYNYPDEHCHHIDLGLVRIFGNLVSFTLEFLGPPHVQNYHNRLIKFSYGDMVRLGRGLRCLSCLKTFRLRNSSIDARKLQILARSLRVMDSLEELDFGYDLMPDDCHEAIRYLLDRPVMFRMLQLEYNKLGSNTAGVLSKALTQEDQEGVLEYLGLAHNPLNETALHTLFQGIIGSPHVLALNISGIVGSKGTGSMGREIGYLLRNHPPLLSLEMASINIGVSQGYLLLRSLEQNQKVLHVDCRECDLDIDQEFEADIIVRRNNYILKNMHHGENLCAVVKDRRHPIVQRIEDYNAARKECCLNRPPLLPPTVEIAPPVVEEKKEEEERDIWAILGINIKPTVPVDTAEERKTVEPRSSVWLPPFVYEPNSFDLEQFRESVYLPGPGNRFFYLQKNKMP